MIYLIRLYRYLWFPYVHLGQNVIDIGDRNISKFVDISPKLLDEMYAPLLLAKPTLDKQLKNYQYREGC
ncbi:hypothetical protein AB7X15_12140 [Proteus mirabilis]|uniref:hypothetical protein n=1 Tax=Proteus mirabilis TaxID=584 RepID=UPI0034E57053